MRKDQFETQGLKRLSKTSDYQIATDETDVRGWAVVDRDGERIGKVDDLLIDTTRMKVAQLDIDIKGGDHISVPAEQAQVDHARREVRVHGYARGAYQTATATDRTASRTDERSHVPRRSFASARVLLKQGKWLSGNTSRPSTSRYP